MDTTNNIGIEESIQEMQDSCIKPEKVTLYNFFKINTPEVIRAKFGISNSNTTVTSSGGLLETLRQYQDNYNLTNYRMEQSLQQNREAYLQLGSYGYEVFSNAIRDYSNNINQNNNA